MATVPRVLTYEEWLQMPPVQDGTDEVVKGELLIVPVRLYPHAEIIQRSILRVARQLDEKKIAILGSNFGLMISREPLTCRSPDVALFRRESIVIQDGLYYSAPDLIVEIISPSETRRRKEEKIADYASIGVPEVWLVSAEAQSVEVKLLTEGQLSTSRILVQGELRPARFAGVAINVTELWPES